MDNLRQFAAAARALLEKNYVGSDTAIVIKDLVRFSEELADHFRTSIATLSYLRKQNALMRVEIQKNQRLLESIRRELSFVQVEAKFISVRDPGESANLNKDSAALIRNACGRIIESVQTQAGQASNLLSGQIEFTADDEDKIKELPIVKEAEEFREQMKIAASKKAG